MNFRQLFFFGMLTAVVSSVVVYLFSAAPVANSVSVQPHIERFVSAFAPEAPLVFPKSSSKQDRFLLAITDNRHLSHVSTDKPVYRPGETVWVRAVLLGAMDERPLDAAQYVNAVLKVIGPKKDTVEELRFDRSENAVIAAQWTVPAGSSGGDYIMRIVYEMNGFPSAERKISVRVFRSPKLKATIDFEKRGYGPGDDVKGTVHVDRADGDPCISGNLVFNAAIDGTILTAVSVPASLDRRGDAQFHFRMPAKIDGDGKGAVSVSVSDGGVAEGAAKTIPIVLHKLDMYLFPEGGSLVPGLESRVYFEARTQAEEPVDVEGELWEVGGTTPIAAVSGVHEGRGVFGFQPADGASYEIRVRKPAGVQPVPLPAILEASKTPGVVMSASGGSSVVEAGDGLKVTVAALGSGRKVRVSAYKREKELSSVSTSKLGSKSGPKTLTLSLPSTVAGVIRVTCWEGDKPLAERLFFLTPPRTLAVNVSADAAAYSPRDAVTITVAVRDEETDRPVEGAVVGVVVSDYSTVGLVDERRRPPLLPSMAYLENEVKELMDPEAYLGDTEHLDLLLGVQGWRQFVYLDPMAHISEDDGDGEGGAEDRTDEVLETDVYERLLVIHHEQRDDFRLMPAAAGPALFAMERAAPMAMAEVAAVPQRIAWAVQEADADDGMALDLGDGIPPMEAEPAAAPVRDGPQPLQAQPAAPFPPPRLPPPAPAKARVAQRKAKRAAKRAPPHKRVYAHAVMPPPPDKDDAAIRQRTDFTETLYWAAALVTSKDGTANVTFHCSDSVTSYRVAAEAHHARTTLQTSDVGLGAWQGEPFRTEQQLSVDVKLPVSVVDGDTIDAPVSIHAGSVGDLKVEALHVRAAGAMERQEGDQGNWEGLLVPRGESAKVVAPIRVQGGMDSEGEISIEAKATHPGASKQGVQLVDAIARKIPVFPAGFPFAQEAGGMLDEHTPLEFAVQIPGDARGLSLKAVVMPSPVATLLEALEALIQEPCGCFEQTSATTYPMVMALQYFETHQGVPPSLIQRVEAMLEKGMRRLKGFEVEGGGFEWFGDAPAHEALSAYGLMQFHDFTKDAMKRTRDFLQQRREDSESSFKMNPKHLDSFGGAPANVARGYIVWSLAQAGEAEGLDKQIDALIQEGESTDDAYVTALAAGTAFNLGKSEQATALARRLVKSQDEDGAVRRAVTTITSSRGASLEIETTSLAILSWLHVDAQFALYTERAIKWLAEQCKGGRFGSTQATVLALKAIIAHDLARSNAGQPGRVQLLVDGHEEASADFDKDSKEALMLTLKGSGDSWSALLPAGLHHVKVSMTGGMPMPVAATLQYNVNVPASAGNSRVALEVRLGQHGSTAEVLEGMTAEIKVSVRKTDEEASALGMVVAIVGLPGGLDVRADRLREGVGSGEYDMYEVRPGNEVVLYWRSLTAEGKDVVIEAVPSAPGVYTGKASRAYEYYADEDKCWVSPLHVVVRPA